MGLDMYLRGEKFFWTDWNNPENNHMEDGEKVHTLKVELAYWRKHPNLHGFIVQTFAKGVDECQEIDLSEDDILKIKAAVLADELPETEGFFFGESSGSDDEKQADLAAFDKALEWKKAQKKGESRSIVYRASW